MDNTVLTTLARYNRAVNAEVSRLVKENEAVVMKPDTTYYGSVLDSLVHVANADIAWLKRTSPDAEPRIKDVKERLKETGSGSEVTIAAWIKIREGLDREIEEFCNGLDEPHLLETLKYKNMKGEEFVRQRWQCLLHMFNHGTHHRGMVAQVFDGAKITNDYSNLISYVK